MSDCVASWGYCKCPECTVRIDTQTGAVVEEEKVVKPEKNPTNGWEALQTIAFLAFLAFVIWMIFG